MLLKLLPLQGARLIAGLPRASALGWELLPLQGVWGELAFIGIFSQDSQDFSQRWEKMRDFLGEKGNDFLFFFTFDSRFLLLLTFSQEMPDFSQNCGFFGEVVGKALFCLIFCSTFASSKKQDNAEMVWCS